MKYTNHPSNYDKSPVIHVKDNNYDCISGWNEITAYLVQKINTLNRNKTIVVVECYPGTDDEEISSYFQNKIPHAKWICADDAFKSEKEISAMVFPDVTDDRVFGFMTNLNIIDYFDPEKLQQIKKSVANVQYETVIVYGCGASLIAPENHLLIYADMARWEIQLRMRRNETHNLGINNKTATYAEQYKHAYFVDWRVCDRLKKQLFRKWDYVLDTNKKNKPILIEGKAILDGLETATKQPFRVVPFFDPGPWGGQWMKEVIDLDRDETNFAWGFDCVPEENSLLLAFDDTVVEIPSINLVFYKPEELLGKKVYARFGDEFPIRFDFLDTMGGGNLSLQVHPTREYIKEKFGMDYTQDESYYMLDAGDQAFVYLGLREDVQPEKMIAELKNAQQTGTFDAERHVAKWPVKKHDHVSIPAGTVHCSGAESMVLEISATPYIFTFKLWDWGRLGLDGRPRPINIEHGEKVIQWNRKANWIKEHALNLVEIVHEDGGVREERTGLNEMEFIETRRHWFTKKVLHNTNDGVNVLNLVEGREAILESPSGAFEPFVIHYAETFIVPAIVGEYTISPYGESEGKQCATIKAYIR